MKKVLFTIVITAILVAVPLVTIGAAAPNAITLSTLDAKITTLQTSISAIQTDISEIQGNISTMQTKLNTLQTTVNTVQGKVTTCVNTTNEILDEVYYIEYFLGAD